MKKTVSIELLQASSDDQKMDFVDTQQRNDVEQYLDKKVGVGA